MSVGARGKCEAVIRSLFGCRELRRDAPGLQIYRVVLRRCSFKVVIEVR
jgi:hypothetical protein